jgi:hypothetical protein
MRFIDVLNQVVIERTNAKFSRKLSEMECNLLVNMLLTNRAQHQLASLNSIDDIVDRLKMLNPSYINAINDSGALVL